MNTVSKYFFLTVLTSILMLGTSSAQNKNALILKGHDFTAEINAYTGNFSIINTSEPDLDLSTLLFTGPATSSYLGFRIDGRNYLLSELRALCPLGISIGSQVDGVFLGGVERDLHIEVAYFIMDIKGSSTFKTLGIAVLMSNTSANQTRKVGAKIMLDTDVGEYKNNPLFHLPDGTKVDTAFKLGASNIAPYIFAGENLKLASEPKGLYIYPNLSENTPSAVVIGNWKQLNNADWIPETIDASFAGNSGIKDAGVGLYFGEYILGPAQSVNFGTAVSVQASPISPLLDEKALKNGVFSEDRFEVNEIFSSPQEYTLFHSNRRIVLPQDSSISNSIPARRGAYRFTKPAHSANEASKTTFETLYRDSVWGALLKLDINFDYQQKKYLESMDISIPEPYPDPPARGIVGTNFFPLNP